MPYKDPSARREYGRRRMRQAREVARDERNARRLSDLEGRSTDPIVCATAAGLFDGEGTATITRSGRNGYSRCFVTLSSTDRDMIDWLHEHWPGSVTETSPADPAHSVFWTWRLNGDHMLPFLYDIEPYLITARRREVVRLVRECQIERWNGQKRPGYLEKIEEYRRAVRALNHRGASA